MFSVVTGLVALVLSGAPGPEKPLPYVPKKIEFLRHPIVRAAPRQGQPVQPTDVLQVRWPRALAASPTRPELVFELRETDLADNAVETQLHLLSLETQEVRQLTRAGQRNVEPAWSPDGRRIVYSSYREEGGVPQLYLLDIEKGGEPVRLTKLTLGASRPVFSPDGKRIAFLSRVYRGCKDEACNRTRQDSGKKAKVRARIHEELLFRHWDSWSDDTVQHVFVLDLDGQRASPPRDLTPGDRDLPVRFLSPGRGFDFFGDNELVVTGNKDERSARSTNHELHGFSLSSGNTRNLTRNPAWDAGPVVSSDGRYIAHLRHARPGFESDRAQLAVYDRKSSEAVSLTEGLDASAYEFAWTRDSQSLYFTSIQRGRRVLQRVEVATKRLDALDLGQAAESPVVTLAGQVVYVDSGLAELPEIHLFDPATKKANPITKLNQEVAKGWDLGGYTDLEITHDGRAVHALVVFPPSFSPRRKYPVLFLIHGGPQSAFIDGWGARWNPQLFAAKGYVVVMPNFRGSLGYGQAYVDAVSRDWGGGPYEDIMAVFDAVAREKWIDAKRVCAAGASYGGYMVNWIAGHTDQFKCLISHAGIYNLESFYGTTEELWFPEWDLGGPPWDASKDYEKYSPHRFIQFASTPMLVTHGAQDFRVSDAEGLQLYTALRRRGVSARLVHYPDEGHWVQKPQNVVHWYGEMLSWLSLHLR